jgi:hypothetical protein
MFLRGGDDGGATQREYTITQTRDLSGVASYSLDAARILLGKYVGRFELLAGWIANNSMSTVIIDWLDNASSVVGSITVLNQQTNPVGWYSIVANFTIPASATKVRITLKAKSPVGSGNAQVAFDALKFRLYDSERPQKSDPIQAFGSASTVFNTTPGSYTIDNQLVWRAHSVFALFDVVNTVPDVRRRFTGTNIAGAAGTYETGYLLWLSGANAGLLNIIRMWTPATKMLKLYFASPYPIASGDRYLYVRTCARRFTEDCRLTFNNQINFRGFPYLPGRLTPE